MIQGSPQCICLGWAYQEFGTTGHFLKLILVNPMEVRLLPCICNVKEQIDSTISMSYYQILVP